MKAKNEVVLMFEPIIEKNHRENLYLKAFQKKAVREFSNNPSKFKKKYDYPLRHYSQMAVNLDPKIMLNIFKKLSINTTNESVTVFGGYTGQFAESLRTIGFDVIFTDPIKEYVKRAKQKGFESHCYSVEELPSNIIEKSDLFATFECYMPFSESSTLVYTTLRLLSSRHGFIFAESGLTRKEMDKEEGKLLRMKSCLKPFEDTYSIKRIFREHDDIRLYHFFKEDGDTGDISIDCKVIKYLYDFSDSDAKISSLLINKISKVSRIPTEKIIQSIHRISKVYHLSIPRSLQLYSPPNQFRIFSKRFIYDS